MGFVGFGQRPCDGSAISLPKASAKQRPCGHGSELALGLAKASAKQRPCAAVSGLALSVIASRCHLSQSERPWQSAKFPVPHFTPCCRKGSRRRFAQTFRLCQGLPLWERLPPAGGRCRICDRGRTAGAKRLRGRGCGQEAAHLVWHCLAEAQPHRKHDLNLGPAPPSAGLPSPSSLTRCHLSQSERPWQSVKFPVWNLYALLPQRSRRRYAEAFRLCQGLPLWERLPPAGGRCRICDRGRTAGAKRLRGRARQRERCAFV